jgi:hypothetical protein
MINILNVSSFIHVVVKNNKLRYLLPITNKMLPTNLNGFLLFLRQKVNKANTNAQNQENEASPRGGRVTEFNVILSWRLCPDA